MLDFTAMGLPADAEIVSSSGPQFSSRDHDEAEETFVVSQNAGRLYRVLVIDVTDNERGDEGIQDLLGKYLNREGY